MGGDSPQNIKPPQFPAWMMGMLNQAGGAGQAAGVAQLNQQQLHPNPIFAHALGQYQGVMVTVNPFAASMPVPLPASKPTIEVAPEAGKRHILKGEV